MLHLAYFTQPLHKSVFSLFLFFFVSFIGLSQSKVYNELERDYQPIASAGTVPYELTVSTEDRISNNMDIVNLDDYSKQKRKEMESFLKSAGFWLEEYFHSGQISYGDEVTNYINEIKDHILESNGFGDREINIFLSKSPRVNAFATPNGKLVINDGLIARTKSEAERAFIIGHEIAHVLREHGLESAEKRSDIIEGKGEYSKLTYFDRLNLLTSRSQHHELDADIKGLEYFEKAGYNASYGNNALTLLQQEYYPFEEFPLTYDFIKSKGIDIPACFFLKEVDEINPNEDFLDKFSTHPNVRSRKDQLNSYLEANPNSDKGKLFVIDEEKFYKIRELTRFELVRQELMNKEYASAMYHTLSLRQKYPDNVFLKKAQAKSLYALSSFKMMGKFEDATRGFALIQGESQRVFYFLKSLTKKQLSSLALKVMYAYSKDPEIANYIYPYMENLTYLMRIHEGLSAEEYLLPYEKGDKLPSGFAEMEPRLQQRYEQRNEKLFYRDLLKEEAKEEAFQSLFSMHDKRVKEYEALEKMPKSQRLKVEEKEKKELLKNGPDISPRSIVFADPKILIIGSKEKATDKNELKESAWAKEIVESARVTAESSSIEFYAVDSKTLTGQDTEKYNNLSLLNEWRNEASSLAYYELIPSNTYIASKIKKELNTTYLCTTVYYSNGKDSKHSYRLRLFDLETGEILYENNKRLSSSASLSTLKKYVNNDISKF